MSAAPGPPPCGIGQLRLLNEALIDIVKGNASEIARVSGAQVQTKGVDATEVNLDLQEMAQSLARRRQWWWS